MARVLEGRNRATADEAASFASELDRIEQGREVKLAELDAEFKKRKRDLNKQFDGEQSGIYEDAKKQGVAKGTLRAIIVGQARIRKAEEKVDAAKERAMDGIDNLEEEARDQAVDIVKALGSDFAGFGLGAAAVEREGSDEDGDPDPVAAAAAQAWKDADPNKGKSAKH
jgi:hypothetical protein